MLWHLRSIEHTKKPTETPGESNIRQHSVIITKKKRDQYQVQGHRTQQQTSEKNIEIHRQIKKQVSTTRPELCKTHPELQHTKIKTHHYIETAILRLYKL